MSDEQIRRLPFGRRPTVHVCMRNDANAPEDRLFAVEIHNRIDGLVISLQADDVLEGVDASLQTQAGEPERRWLNLGGERCTPLDGFRHYVGNILWDAGTTSTGEAFRLVRALLELGFHVEEVVEP